MIWRGRSVKSTSSGSPPLLFYLHEVEVTEDAVNHEGYGQHHGVVRWQVGGRECIQAVGDDGAAGYDQDELVEQREGISF